MVVVDHLRVLIIDDSLTIRALLEELIEREPGCRVVGRASDASDARAMMTDLIPNVVTLDLNMPGVDGMTFLDELRGTSHPPIIVVSSTTVAGSAGAAEAIRRGAYACFDKSRMVVDAAHFVRLLKAAARSRGAKGQPNV